MAFYDEIQAQLMTFTYFNNTGWDYAVAALVFLGLFISLRIFKTIVLAYLNVLAKKTKNQIDDYVIGIVNSIHWPYYAFIAVYIATLFLTIPDTVSQGRDILLIIFTGYYVVKALQSMVDVYIQSYEKRQKEDAHALHFVGVIVKGALWVLVILAILANLGINITSLIAGLGIAGIAIGLALQNVLADIFASVSIFFDKPFKRGDFIIVGDKMGTVQHIGIKTTRVKALQGEEIVFSNTQLTKAELRNFKKMQKRRIAFSIGVTYDTPVAKLEKIPDTIMKILTAEKLAEADRVHFKSFGDFSLNYEIVYYMLDPDYGKFMDTQQSINLAIAKAFQKDKIEFAFPTQTIILDK